MGSAVRRVTTFLVFGALLLLPSFSGAEYLGVPDNKHILGMLQDVTVIDSVFLLAGS